MDIKTIELVTRPVQAVQFTGNDNDNADLQAWLQDRLSFQRVTVTVDRLYLPSVGGMEILERGDWVLYDPIENAFRGATNEAIETHYVEVSEEAEAGE